MKRFKTKLTALETVKKNKENIALMSYVEKQKELILKNKEKEILIQKLRQALQQRESAPQNISNKNEMNVIQLYVDGLKQKIIKQMNIIQVAQKNIEKAKLNLLEKTKDKKIVSKLISKREEKYIKEGSKKQNNILSEMYIMRKNKGSSGVFE